jgi:hypothetical protein
MALVAGYSMTVGESRPIPYTATQDSGAAFDLTGYTLKFTLKRTPDGGTPYLLQKTMTITNPAQGLATLTLLTADTIAQGRQGDADPQPGGPHQRRDQGRPRRLVRARRAAAVLVAPESVRGRALGLPGRLEPEHPAPRRAGRERDQLRRPARPGRPDAGRPRPAPARHREAQGPDGVAALVHPRPRRESDGGKKARDIEKALRFPDGSTPSRSGSGCSSRTCSSSTRRRSTSRPRCSATWCRR